MHNHGITCTETSIAMPHNGGATAVDPGFGREVLSCFSKIIGFIFAKLLIYNLLKIPSVSAITPVVDIGNNITLLGKILVPPICSKNCSLHPANQVLHKLP